MVPDVIHRAADMGGGGGSRDYDPDRDPRREQRDDLPPTFLHEISFRAALDWSH
jgi:hypothetical protein